MIEDYDSLNVGDKVIAHSKTRPELEGKVCTIVEKILYDEEKNKPFLCNDKYLIAVDIFGGKPYCLINSKVPWKTDEELLLVYDYELYKE